MRMLYHGLYKGKHNKHIALLFDVSGHQFIVMDLPLLFESGTMLDYLYKIIVVTW
jgi:hypothetical protein